MPRCVPKAKWCLPVCHELCEHPTLVDMEVIVRRQNQEHNASITSMIRHYVARRAQVTEGHPHNAANGVPLLPVEGDVAGHGSRGRSRKTMDLAGY